MAWFSLSVRVPEQARQCSGAFYDGLARSSIQVTSPITSRYAGRIRANSYQRRRHGGSENFDLSLAGHSVASLLQTPTFRVLRLDELCASRLHSEPFPSGLQRHSFNFELPQSLAFGMDALLDSTSLVDQSPCFFTVGGSSSTSSGAEHHAIDFLVIPRDVLESRDDNRCLGEFSESEGFKVAVELALTQAHRRWHMFTPELAQRTYNVVLPYGIFRVEKRDFIGVPVITMTRRPGRGQFRRSLSISLVLVPHVSISSGPNVPFRVWGQLLDDSAMSLANAPVTDPRCEMFEMLESPLASYLNEAATGIRQLTPLVQPVDAWMRDISRSVLTKLTGKREPSDLANLIEKNLLAASSLGVRRGAVLLLSDFDDCELTLLSRGGGAKETKVSSLLDALGEMELGVSDWRAASIATTTTLKSSEYVYYLPERRTLLALMPSPAWEEPPGQSLRFLLSVLLSVTIGLSTVRSIAYFFHHEVELVRRNRRLGELTTEFVTDLDEAYDLDLTVPAYKRLYEEIKDRSQVERDFAHVRWSLGTLSERLSAEESRKATVSVLFFTITIALGTLALVFKGEQDILGLGAAGCATGAAVSVFWRSRLSRV